MDTPSPRTRRTPRRRLRFSEACRAWPVVLSLMALTGTPRTWSATPSARIDYALAFLPSQNALILHGGWGNPDWEPRNDVWKLDATGWSLMTVSDSPAMANHTMTCDTTRGVLVACGEGSHPFETWEFDGSGWTAAPNPPITKSGMPRLAYDGARQRVVLYWADYSATSQATWEYDGSQWTQMTPSVSPPALPYASLMTYDETLARTVLVGAMTSTSAQTWLWDGVTWTQAAGSQPTDPRAGGMAYDSARKQTVLLAIDMTTWTFDGTGWTRLTPAHSPTPAGLMFISMACDPVRQVSVFFGGEQCGGAGCVDPDVTWEWDGQDWSELSAESPSVSLTIRRVPPDKVEIRWPASAVGWTLHTTSDLSSPDPWPSESTAPTSEGNESVVTLNAADPARFYRLHTP